jgi:hypothetical protein
VIEEPQDGHVQIALSLYQLDSQIGDAQVELYFASATGPSRRPASSARKRAV